MTEEKFDLKKLAHIKFKATNALKKILKGKPKDLSLAKIIKAPPSSTRPKQEIFYVILIGILIAFVIRSFLVQIYTVPSNSMEPELRTRDRIMANKSSYGIPNPFFSLADSVKIFGVFNNPFYGKLGGIAVNKYLLGFSGPKRMDVVVFTFPAVSQHFQKGNYLPIKIIEGQRELIKRVVGLPGETIKIRRGNVYINGKLLKEAPSTNRDNSNFGPLKIGPDSYFVLGDNRSSSYDSRAWGTLPRANIAGIVFIRVWPFIRIGLIK